MSQARRWFRLLWPRELTADDALQVLLELRGANGVVLELHGDAERVAHQLGVAQAQAEAVRQRLAAVLPAIVLEETTDEPRPPLTAAWRLVRRGDLPLSVERAEAVSRAVLGVFGSIHGQEVLVLQLVLGRPLAPARVPPTATTSSGDSWLSALLRAPFISPERMPATERRKLQDKWSLPGWRLTARLGVAAASPERARQLGWLVLMALRIAEGPGAHLIKRRTDPTTLMKARPGLLTSGSANAAELSLLASFPVGDANVPSLLRQTHRLLMPGVPLPKTGTLLAEAPAGQPLRLSPALAREGLLVTGPTGTGKSTLLLSMITQSLAAGRGLILLDPKGDLATDVLARIPASRRDDVVVLDPLDDQAVVGLNPLAAGGSPELAADGLLAVFQAMHGDYLGPRSTDLLQASLLTLASVGGQTLVSLPVLLTSERLRRRLVPQLAGQPVLASFWSWFESLGAPEQTTVTAPLLNKVRPLLYRSGLRRVLGQASPRFSLSSIFTERKVLIVSLARGALGPAGASLLGALLLSSLWRAIEQRVNVPAERRSFVPIYADEAGDYVRLPIDLADALAKSRGFSVGWTLAGQHLQQYPTQLRASVLANARNRVCFTLGPDDARTMAGASGGRLKAEDFLGLPRFASYVQLSGYGWFSGRTLAPTPATTDAAELRALSRQRYGVPVTELDAELGDMLGTSGQDDDSTALGRRRRPL